MDLDSALNSWLEESHGGGLWRPVVLIVESNDSTRETLRSFFLEQDTVVYCVPDREQAVRFSRLIEGDRKPDLVMIGVRPRETIQGLKSTIEASPGRGEPSFYQYLTGRFLDSTRLLQQAKFHLDSVRTQRKLRKAKEDLDAKKARRNSAWGTAPGKGFKIPE